LARLLSALSLLLVLFLGSVLLPTTSHAEPSNLDEVKAERQKLKDKLSDKEKEIVKVLDEIEELHIEIKKIEDALKENNKQIEKTNKAISTYEDEIEEIQEDIDELNVEIEKRSKILKERISNYQMNGGNIQFLQVILGSTSFNDFISRYAAVVQITNADADLIKKQEEDRKLIEIKQSKVEKKLAEQEELKVELEGILETIKEQEKKTTKEKKKLEKKEEKLKKEKSKLNSEDRNLANLEANYRNSMSSYSPRTASVKTASTKANASNFSGGGSKSTAINAGFNHLGTPYVWAGKGPGGFDCSGFVSWAYGQAGYNIPSSTAGLSSTGSQVSYSQAQPGDLIFFNTYKTNGHVGIYLGGGKFIGAQNSTGLAVASVNSTYWSKAFKGHVRRIN